MDKPLFLNQNQADEKLVYLRIMNYRESNAVFAVLVSGEMKDAGVPFRTITAMPDEELPAFHAAVRVENKDLAQLLIRQGLADPRDELVHSGFNTLYVLAFNRDVLMEYDPNGTQDYEERINNRNERTDDA